jgi:pilus assembly protein CpaF
VFAVVISEKGGAERREVFDRTEVSVGRVRGNDLVLSKGNVSKRHARLTQKDGRFVVVDQNSTNGTYVNRQRIVQATIVREGDRIYIGDFILRIEETAEGAEVSVAEGAVRGPDAETGESTHWSEPSVVEQSSPKLPPAPRLPASLPRAMRRASEVPGTATIGDTFKSTKIEPAALPVGDLLPIESVRLLVERVLEKIERRSVERDVGDAVARRVERVLLEELARLKDEKGVSPQLTDEQLLVATRAELIGLGPLEALMRNPNATQITANGTKSVSIVQNDRLNYAALPFSSAASVDRVLARLCRMSEVSHDGRETFLSGRLSNGVAWKAVRQRAAPDGIVLSLRRRPSVECRIEDLVRDGTVSRAVATFLGHCIAARLNVIVVGPRASSVNRVLSSLADAASNRQLLALEEHCHLVASSGEAVRLDAATAAMDPGRLVDFASSLPETQLLVESLAGRWLPSVLEIIAKGFEGVSGGLHANTTEQGLSRLSAQLCTLNPGVGVETARQSIISSFDVVIEVSAPTDGRDRVRRVSEWFTTPGGATQMQDIFTFQVERTAAGGALEGTFQATGAEPKLLAELRSRGITIERNLFQRSSASAG